MFNKLKIALSLSILFSSLIALKSASGSPLFTLSNQTGGQNPWVGDMWLPMGDAGKNNFFSDWQGAYSADQGNGSFEVGMIDRRMQKNDWALGGYVYGSYNRAPLGLNFGTVNPGLEFLNNHWHISWNAYIPASATTQKIAHAQWADELGVYNYIQFKEHDQFNRMVQPIEATGAGTDLLASYRFSQLHDTAFTLGTYYFNMPKHPVGLIAEVTSPSIHHLSFQLAYHHDPLTSNSVLLSASLHFGGDQSADNDWVNEPVQHNAAMLGNANTIPFSEKINPVGPLQLQRDNVWFFAPHGADFDPALGVANCTYEHPCAGITNEATLAIGEYNNLGLFHNDPDLYVRTGEYNYAPNYALYLFSNESIIGRNSDYTEPAKENARPIFSLSSLVIDGNFGNKLNDVANLQFQNNGGADPAITIVRGQDILLDNLKIGSSDLDLSYGGGVAVEDSDHVLIKDSDIYGSNYLLPSSYSPSGVFAYNVQDLVIDHSTIHAISVGDNGGDATALWLNGGNQVTIDHSTLNSQASGDNNEGAIAIFSAVGTANQVMVNHSQLSANATGDGTTSTVVQASGDADITIRNSILSGTESSTGSNDGVYGFSLSGAAHVNFVHSSLNTYADSTAGKAASTNFSLSDNSVAHITDSRLNSDANSAQVTGNTNVSAFDDAQAFVRGSRLSVSMAGGPSTGEPSGAINIWTLNQSHVEINNSVLHAISGNNLTNAANLQAQNDSQIDVNKSILRMSDPHGTITDVPASSVLAADNSLIQITHSSIFASVNGVMVNDLQVIQSYDHASIAMSNSSIVANNQAHTESGGAVKTIGAYAADSSVISLHNVAMHLIGEDTEETATEGDGQVIVTN